MIEQKCKGGEFYAHSTREYNAICAKQGNSSIDQLQSTVTYTSVLIGVVARLMLHPSIFLAPHLPRAALDSSHMNASKLQ